MMPSLKFCELLLRDGIQGWPTVIPLADKLRLLALIDAAGVAEIDVTSFVPAPQFADAAGLLGGHEFRAEVRVLAVNARGVERAIDAHRHIHTITTCGMPISASESHNLANLRCDHATHKQRLTLMAEQLQAAGIRPMVCVATAWGCPIEGAVAADQVMELVSWLQSIGVNHVMLGDTTGMANPGSVYTLFGQLRTEWPALDLIAHFHDNRGCAMANVLAAIQAGVTSVDGCLGGLGGEPASVEQGHVGESGNVISEDLIGMLTAMGYATGIDREKLLEAGALAEQILGRPLFSKLQRLQ